MSLRPALRQSLRAATVRPATRALSSTAARRAGHDGHHQSDSKADTEESFVSPLWTRRFLIVAVAVAVYPYLPATIKGSASPSVSNENLEKEASDKSTPIVTRILAKEMEGNNNTWSQRNDKHLELSVEAADTKLLFQEAEQPKVWRLRYPSSFEQASPHCISVGSQADLSDLVVKRDE